MFGISELYSAAIRHDIASEDLDIKPQPSILILSHKSVRGMDYAYFYAH
jgi:hypothetical protein